VVAIDLSPNLVGLAQERLPHDIGPGKVSFFVGDMTDQGLGTFDHVVAMDSLIHYRATDIAGALAGLSARTGGSILFTFAPRTPLLSVMHATGKLFPRSDRSPAIEPVSERTLRARLATGLGHTGFRAHRTERVTGGFYTSQAMELVRA